MGCMASTVPLPDEATALFREAPERFVSARDALAKRLRDESRPEDAATVKALRKPTVVTWTLNQLASRDTEGVRALLDAGADVRAVQQAALSSSKGAGERLRKASAARRSAVTRLINVAREVLADAGKVSVSDTHVNAIRRALETSSTDPDAGQRLLEGIFESPPKDAPGFGDVAGLVVVPTPIPERQKAPASSGRAKPSARAGTQRAEGTRLRRDREAALRVARKAREAADRYGVELEGMRRRLTVVEEKHRAAEADASAKELEAKRAEHAADEATDQP
jgi:hypothetical protein